MNLLARVFNHLLSLLPRSWSSPGVASWHGPQPLTRTGKPRVAAIRRAARKARSRRGLNHGRT